MNKCVVFFFVGRKLVNSWLAGFKTKEFMWIFNSIHLYLQPTCIYYYFYNIIYCSRCILQTIHSNCGRAQNKIAQSNREEIYEKS